jgi:ATP-dependent DNA helicase RecG
MNLDTSVSNLRFVGPTYARRLSNLGIFTIKDLLYHFPSRYEDLTATKKISETRVGDIATLKASVWQIKNIRTRTGKFLTQAVLNDGSGSIEAVWFNQPFLTKTLKTGLSVNFSGKVAEFARKPTLVSPEYEILKEGSGTLHTGRLVPIYPETFGVSSKWLRSRIKPLLDTYSRELIDIIPPAVRKRHNLLSPTEAILKIHFPSDLSQIEESRRRFGFEEMFLVKLRSEQKKRDWKKQAVGTRFKVDQIKVKEFINSLPFELTGAQKRVTEEILKDLAKSEPMNRLLEGDVGSGKTVVSAIAIYVSYLNGFSAALMAPTEILASQHFETLRSLLTPMGLKVVLQTGSKKMAQKDVSFDLIVGTHALLTEKLGLHDLGLIIIDEQHRFGVEQRATLRSRGKPAHVLTMTATPIPRTMALTIFGDLDLSVIDEMPHGRQVIKTYLVPPEKRASAYQFIADHIRKGEQAFIIAPFIEPSETLSTVKSATTEFNHLAKEVFPQYKLGLLHGRLKSKEKDQVLTDFRNKVYHLLVATPVVEVGIDIANATIMLIEGAERFGLSQIHQLRGRVGRSDLQSYCLLFTDNPNPHVISRLKMLEKYHIGMEVAEADLKTRGPGDMYGLMQSGAPGLKVADFTDLDLIESVHGAVNTLLKEDPDLTAYPPLQKELLALVAKVAPD